MSVPSTSRRDFLKSAALLPLAAAGAGLTASSAEAMEPVHRVGSPELKVSLNAFSFDRLLRENLARPGSGASMFDLLDFCAEHGFDGIDATGYYFPGYPAAPDDEYLYRFKRRAFELGIAISGTGTRNYFINPDEKLHREGVENIKTWVEVASRMGASVLRVFADDMTRHESWKKACPGYTHEQVEDWTAAALHECAEHGEKYGVLIGVQNHGDFNGTAEEFLSLLGKINSDWCGAVLDTGYFDTPDPYVDIEKVAPYAVNWTIKESAFDGGYGSVPMDLERLMRIVRRSGYRGYLPIEALYPKGSHLDPYKEVPKFLAKVRSAIRATAAA